MCVAIPGLVKKKKDGKVTVDFNGNEVDIVKFLRVGTQGTQPVMITYGGER